MDSLDPIIGNKTALGSTPFEGFILLESFIVKSKCSLLVPFQKSIVNHLQNRFSGAIRKTGRFHTPNAMSSR